MKREELTRYLDEILDDQLEALDELKRVFRERVAETLERLRSDAT